LVQGKSGELYPANLQVANASGQSNASGFDLVVLGCHLVLKALVLTNPQNGGEKVTPIRCPSCKADFPEGNTESGCVVEMISVQSPDLGEPVDASCCGACLAGFRCNHRRNWFVPRFGDEGCRLNFSIDPRRKTCQS